MNYYSIYPAVIQLANNFRDLQIRMGPQLVNVVVTRSPIVF
ncbi:hypothetical protein OROMI_023930 [Orobanche minor]